MKKLVKLSCCLVSIVGVCMAQEKLNGDISGNYKAGEYLIAEDVVVPSKTTLSFAPGSVLRFGNYAGITVYGKIVCNGTPQKPIVFTSANDVPHAKTLPEAFDWNGIKVSFEAEGVSFEHCTIAYSTFGLNIESNATPVSIKNITFIHNGTVSLTRGKKMIPVQETAPISFMWPEKTTTTAEAGGQGGRLADGVGDEGVNTKASPAPVSADKADKYRHGRRVRRITFGAVAAGCGVAGVLFQLRSANLYNDYMADHSYDVARHDADWQAVTKAEKTRNLFYALAGASAAAFTISIPF
ncbi:MAG: hypothetical protein JXA71_06530 [Chitinispirillaceae bacterium]|nr:hypothetical protein [Chitinispirillaceae bacterium]